MIATTLAAILLVFLPHGGHGYSGQSLQITLTPAVQTRREHWQIHWRLTRGPLELARGQRNADGPATAVDLPLPVVRSVTKVQWHYELYAPDAASHDTLALLDQGQVAIWIHPPENLPWARGFANHATLTVLDHDVTAQADGLPLADWLRELGFKVRVAHVNDTMAIQQAQWLIVVEGVHEARVMQSVHMACERGTRLMMIGSSSLSNNWINARDTLDVTRPSAAVTLKTGHPLLANFENTWLETWVNETPTVVARRVDVQSGGTSVVGWLHPDTLSLEADAAHVNDRKASKPRMLDALVWAQTIGDGHAVFWRLNVTDWREDPRALLMLSNMMLYLMNPPLPIQNLTPTAASKETP